MPLHSQRRGFLSAHRACITQHACSVAARGPSLGTWCHPDKIFQYTMFYLGRDRRVMKTRTR